MHIRTEVHRLFVIFIFTPMLFADTTAPSLGELIPNDILPFQIIDEANEAYRNGEYRKSVLLFESLKLDSDIVLYNQANAEYKSGMYDEALKHYTKAKDVSKSIRLYNIGNCYFKKGDFKLAIKYYTSSLKLKSDEDVMHNLRLAREKRKEQQKNKNKKRKEEKKEKKKKEKEKRDNREKKEVEKKRISSKKSQHPIVKQKIGKKKNSKEKQRKKELSHLIKQLSKRKMPTMMYQGREKIGEKNVQNPW